jgi:hypothetical protein
MARILWIGGSNPAIRQQLEEAGHEVVVEGKPIDGHLDLKGHPRTNLIVWDGDILTSSNLLLRSVAHFEGIRAAYPNLKQVAVVRNNSMSAQLRSLGIEQVIPLLMAVSRIKAILVEVLPTE